MRELVLHSIMRAPLSPRDLFVLVSRLRPEAADGRGASRGSPAAGASVGWESPLGQVPLNLVLPHSRVACFERAIQRIDVGAGVQVISFLGLDGCISSGRSDTNPAAQHLRDSKDVPDNLLKVTVVGDESVLQVGLP